MKITRKKLAEKFFVPRYCHITLLGMSAPITFIFGSQGLHQGFKGKYFGQEFQFFSSRNKNNFFLFFITISLKIFKTPCWWRAVLKMSESLKRALRCEVPKSFECFARNGIKRLELPSRKENREEIHHKQRKNQLIIGTSIFYYCFSLKECALGENIVSLKNSIVITFVR